VQRAAMFSWHSSARATLDVYSEVVGENPKKTVPESLLAEAHRGKR
jgi:hypothetical protein